MQKIFWSTLLLMVGAAVGVYLTASYSRTCGSPLRPAVRTAPTSDESNGVEPLVMLPQTPPKFMFDVVEPILVQPEIEDRAPAPTFEDLAPVPPVAESPVPTRMPYADEAIETTEGNDKTLLANLADFLNHLLPGIPNSEAPASVEEAQDAVPDEVFPRVDDEDKNDATTMPLIPADHDHHHPSCPYLHGHPRGYPTFPTPAYQYERPRF